MAQIGKEARSVPRSVRRGRPAASGNIEQAAVGSRNGATRDGQHSTLVTEARRNSSRKASVIESGIYGHRANERMRSG